MTDRIPEIWQQAEQLAARSYAVKTSQDTLSNGDTVYVAENPELGTIAHGGTPEQALRELSLARVSLIYYMLLDAVRVPEPSGAVVTASSGTQVEARWGEFASQSGSEAAHERAADPPEDATGSGRGAICFSVVEGPFVAR